MNIAYMTRKYSHDIRHKIEQIRSIIKKGNIGVTSNLYISLLIY